MAAPQKIIVAGISGSGKTTVTKMISEELNLPLVTIDSFAFDSNWKRRPREEIRKSVMEGLSMDKWIIDGMYRFLTEEFVPSADVLVFIRINYITNLINIIKRKLGHILRPTEDTYIGKKNKIKLHNFKLITRKRSEFFKHWENCMKMLDDSIRVICIKNTRRKTVEKLLRQLKNQ